MWSLDLFQCSCYQNRNDLFPPFIIQGKTFSFWRHGIVQLKPVIVFSVSSIVAFCVMQFLLKKVTSEGNKIEILEISHLVKKVRLNGITRHFGRHDNYFRAT